MSIDSVQKDGRIKSLTGTLWPGARISRKRKGISVSSEVIVQVNSMACAKLLAILLSDVSLLILLLFSPLPSLVPRPCQEFVICVLQAQQLCDMFAFVLVHM